MKVSIKDFAVSMEIKNKGVELDVYKATTASTSGIWSCSPHLPTDRRRDFAR